MKNNSLIIVLVSVILFLGSCKPQQDDAIELSAVPSNISFTVEEKVGEVNVYILKNTTPAGPFLFQWDLGNGATATGQTTEVYFPLMGDYEVSLRAFNDGGFGTSTMTITVLEDDPNPCQPGSLTEFLTNCDELTWTLLQGEGAYWVGPTDLSQTWWMNAAADVTTRFCAFDDEWTFRISGEMEYDTKGDLWAESYMGFSDECVTDDQLDAAVKPWASGTHNFTASEIGGVEQIQVVGLGAFMGLPKAANGAEVTAPVSAITYDVVNRGTDADGKFLEIEVNYSVGIWRFKFVAQ